MKGYPIDAIKAYKAGKLEKCELANRFAMWQSSLGIDLACRVNLISKDVGFCVAYRGQKGIFHRCGVVWNGKKHSSILFFQRAVDHYLCEKLNQIKREKMATYGF